MSIGPEPLKARHVNLTIPRIILNVMITENVKTVLGSRGLNDLMGSSRSETLHFFLYLPLARQKH